MPFMLSVQVCMCIRTVTDITNTCVYRTTRVNESIALVLSTKDAEEKQALAVKLVFT